MKPPAPATKAVSGLLNSDPPSRALRHELFHNAPKIAERCGLRLLIER
jgi:hypothetical protein